MGYFPQNLLIFGLKDYFRNQDSLSISHKMCMREVLQIKPILGCMARFVGLYVIEESVLAGQSTVLYVALSKCQICLLNIKMFVQISYKTG